MKPIVAISFFLAAGSALFPIGGLEKMGLAKDPYREGPFTVYARVHVFPEKTSTAICVAVGTRVAVETKSDLFLVTLR